MRRHRDAAIEAAEVLVERIDTVVIELTDVVAGLRAYILEQEEEKSDGRD